jgi:hypothetical protein
MTEKNDTPEAPEVKAPEPVKKKRGFMIIELVDAKPLALPGNSEFRYGIEFVVQEDGRLVGETKTAIAKAGIDAGLYREIK